MTFSFGPTQRSNPSLKSWCWRVLVQETTPVTPMGLLRRFLLLKQVTVLLSPQGAALPLLVGCVFSVKTLALLRSPHISTKPCSVFLGHLALVGLLPLPHLALQLAQATLGLAQATLGLAQATLGPARTDASPAGGDRDAAGAWAWQWRSEAAAPRILSERLLDAHLLASLLLLGLLGLEGVLVARWAPQTRRLRTARYAQLGCGLVWALVLLELLLLLLLLPTADAGAVTGVYDESVSYGLALPNSSVYLRRALWLVNVWLHYFAIHRRPQKKDSCFH